MNVEELVRDALRETAEAQSPAGPGLADRVLAVRRRRRGRRIAALAVGVPRLVSAEGDVRPRASWGTAGRVPDQSPPRELIAAGEAAPAAYYTTELQERTAASGRYEKNTRWSFAAVAPGLRTAAVLERTLPA